MKDAGNLNIHVFGDWIKTIKENKSRKAIPRCDKNHTVLFR